MNLRTFLSILVGFVVLSICSPRLLVAQSLTAGSVAGTVTDPTGSVVPGANVALKSTTGGETRQGTTNKDGSFLFDLLTPGSYGITITATGFQSQSRPVQVAVGASATVNFQLTLGSRSEVITVEATAPLLHTENANISSTVNESQAANIPNPGNDITYLVQIAPGSVANTTGGYGNLSSYGMSALTTLFTLNGMDYNDPFFNLNNSGATNLTLGQNEIEEVSVVSNGYSGEYGGLAGANVNYITRSGTNSFHGRSTYYWNGRTMNANSWFKNATDTPRSFVNANQYGADIGGPIMKDKLFFYFNAEGLYLLIPTGSTVNVPSPAFQTATLANISTTFGGPTSTIYKFYQNMFSLYNGAPGVSRATNSLPDGGCDTSEALFNPFAGATFGGGGLPCALTFQSNVGAATHENLQAGRVDWNVTSHDRFFVRIQHDLGFQASATDPINKLFNLVSEQPEWQGQAQETHSWDNGSANQIIVSGQWYQAQFSEADRDASLAAFPTTMLFASGQFSTLGGLDEIAPQGRNITQFQVSDDYSKPIGNHSLKVGIKYRRNWTSDYDFSEYTSGLHIPITLDAFFWGGIDPVPANAATGNFTELLQAFPVAPVLSFAGYSIGGYINDDWRVRSNLMLTLAFRLDHQSDPVCSTNCFVLPATPFPGLNTDATTPYNQLLHVDQRRLLPGFTAVEPAERIGLAWQPHVLGMHDMVVRGGFGVFWDQFPAVSLDGIAENPPNDPTFTVVGGNLSAASDPSSLFAQAAASNAAFQAGFASGGSFSTISAAVPGFTAPALSSPQQNSKAAEYYRWSLGIEQQLGKQTVLSVQYVGNHGIHIFFLNNAINGFDGTGTFTDLPATVPNPSFATVSYGQTIGVASYNGVSTSLTHRYASGQWQINYLYGHALDDVSNSGILPFTSPGFGATNLSVLYPEDPANPKKFNYGSSDQDVRNTLNGNFVWELPLKRFITRGHGPDRLLRGWDVNGAVFVRSGFPLTLVDGATSSALESSNFGSSSAEAFVFGTRLAPGGTGVNCATTFTGTPQPSRGICLNPADFSTSPDGFPDTTRNTFVGPSYFNTDFSLMKHTQIWERAELVIGAQFFNILNHANFDAPVMDVSSAQFGEILRTVSSPTSMYGSALGADASPRLIQMKVQVNF